MGVLSAQRPLLSVAVEPLAGEVVLHVDGAIDISTCDLLRDAVEAHLGPHQAIVLDLANVEFMDSSCLHALERAQAALATDGGSLILRNPSRAAHRLLTAAGAQRLLDAIQPPRGAR